MNGIEFANALRMSNVDPTLTKAFEDEKDENNNRKYAQKDRRWWDNSTKTQKEHLICWFSRRYYNNSTQECINNCFNKSCQNCYFKREKITPIVSKSNKKDAKSIYYSMGRPEMYFCVFELLEIGEPGDLTKCINAVENALDDKASWKNIVTGYAQWDDIERAARKILDNE